MKCICLRITLRNEFNHSDCVIKIRFGKQFSIETRISDTYTDVDESLELRVVDLEQRVAQLETENDELRARVDNLERNTMALAVRGTDSGIYWTNMMETLGVGGVNFLVRLLTALRYVYWRMICIFVRGSDGKMYHGWVDLGTDDFSGWTVLDGSTPNSPVLIPLP